MKALFITLAVILFTGSMVCVALLVKMKLNVVDTYRIGKKYNYIYKCIEI